MNQSFIHKGFSNLPSVSMNLATAPEPERWPKGKKAVSPKVLVADADDSNLSLISRLIEAEGFRVVVARDGREAHRILQSTSDFVAAIFEVVIPHVSGPDLVRFMRREKLLRRIPVIMMTRPGSARLWSESFSAGAAVLLPEPFSGSQLQNLIHTLVENSSTITTP